MLDRLNVCDECQVLIDKEILRQVDKEDDNSSAESE